MLFCENCSVFSAPPPPRGFIRVAATPHCLKLPKKISFVPTCLNKYSKTFGTVRTKMQVDTFERLKDPNHLFDNHFYIHKLCIYLAYPMPLQIHICDEMASIFLVDDQWSLIIPSKIHLQPNPLGGSVLKLPPLVERLREGLPSTVPTLLIATLLLCGETWSTSPSGWNNVEVIEHKIGVHWLGHNLVQIYVVSPYYFQNVQHTRILVSTCVRLSMIDWTWAIWSWREAYVEGG